jgi:uncharacterized repeat protein (TIGR04076 family)
MPKGKITVLKKDQTHTTKTQQRSDNVVITYHIRTCPRLKQGQEFYLDNAHTPPPGFCNLAWMDIKNLVSRVVQGNGNTAFTHCTEGCEPVTFKIEKLMS